jgi:membrane protease YdiL (CAAX protease family)
LLHLAQPSLVIAAVFIALLATSVGVRTPDRLQADRRWLIVIAAGVAMFAIGRVLSGGQSPAPLTAKVLVLNSLAAVAEEAFFRRVVYSALAPAGATFAVGGSAALFALVHITTYGAWVLPLDLAAGLVLGWQRWASKTWSAPAVTHVLANVLVVV